MSEFISKKNEITTPVCNRCLNHISGVKCKAFNVIPDEILLGDNNHYEKLEGQINDYLFKDNQSQ